MEILLISLLTLIAATIGTISGFGTSTIMVPVLVLWFPLPVTLFLVGIIHWVGANLVFTIPEELLSRVLGTCLIAYSLFIFFYPSFKFRRGAWTALIGGGLSGFLAGISGIGGAVRGAFLSAFDLEKAVYIATIGAIGVIIDSARLIAYWQDGATVGNLPYLSVLVFIPISFIGAGIGKKIITRIPQQIFRIVVAVFLFLIALKLVI